MDGLILGMPDFNEVLADHKDVLLVGGMGVPLSFAMLSMGHHVVEVVPFIKAPMAEVILDGAIGGGIIIVSSGVMPSFESHEMILRILEEKFSYPVEPLSSLMNLQELQMASLEDLFETPVVKKTGQRDKGFMSKVAPKKLFGDKRLDISQRTGYHQRHS